MLKRLYKILSSRMFWMVLFFSGQLALILYFVLWSALGHQNYIFFIVLSMIMALIIITRKEKNDYRLIWMFVLIIFPFFGGVLYLLFANKKIGSLSEMPTGSSTLSLPSSAARADA